MEVIHRYSETHTLYKSQIKDFLLMDIINWEYNRPADMIRCNEIAKYITTKKPELDWIFYIIYRKTTNKYHIIDGIHRYNALKIIKTENEKPVDYITPSVLCEPRIKEWLYNKNVILSIREDTTIGEEIDLFQSLNKSNPVPELYMVNDNQKKREIIERVANEWQTNYKTHFTANRKPNIPNTNRELFIEMLDYVYEKYNITEDNSNILLDKLTNMNNHIMNNIPIKKSSKTIEKCKETGCYLFLLKTQVLETMI